MELDMLALVYDVVRDLIQALEQEWSNGYLDEKSTDLLSGCYSVCDFMANELASFEREEIEAENDSPIKVSQYLASLDSMKECEKTLADNLSDDRCPSYIDYRKVQALAGFRKIIPYIAELVEILKD